MSIQKKTVSLTINEDLVNSWIEGGLWMMRLIEDGEYVTGISANADGSYNITLKSKGDKRQIDLAFLGKDNT